MELTPIINDTFLVEKRTSTSGFKYSDWTYVVLADFPGALKKRNGTVRVKGMIDDYMLNQYNLLPMKDGAMMLPLKAAIRKKIGKKEGDFVHVILFLDDAQVEIPTDMLACLLDAPKAHDFFLSLSDSNQKYYIDWIEESKKAETKAKRIITMIDRLENKLKFYDWLKQD